MAENLENGTVLAGDTGGGFTLPGKSGSTLRDERMERMALKRWSHRLTEDKRNQMFNRQVAIAISAESNREATQAFKAVIDAESVDDEISGLKPGGTVTNIQNTLVLGNMTLEQKRALLERHREINGQVPDDSAGS